MTVTIKCSWCEDSQTYGQYGEPTDDTEVVQMAKREGWAKNGEGEWVCPGCIRFDPDLRELHKTRQIVPPWVSGQSPAGPEVA